MVVATAISLLENSNNLLTMMSPGQLSYTIWSIAKLSPLLTTTKPILSIKIISSIVTKLNDMHGKYSKRREHASRNGSTVVDIHISPPSFKRVALYFLRYPLSKTPKQVFFNPYKYILTSFTTHSITDFIIILFFV